MDESKNHWPAILGAAAAPRDELVRSPASPASATFAPLPPMPLAYQYLDIRWPPLFERLRWLPPGACRRCRRRRGAGARSAWGVLPGELLDGLLVWPQLPRRHHQVTRRALSAAISCQPARAWRRLPPMLVGWLATLALAPMLLRPPDLISGEMKLLVGFVGDPRRLPMNESARRPKCRQYHRPRPPSYGKTTKKKRGQT